jgi:hypothetical protein
VQLDKTTIAVRERSWLDTLDLSLHVLRAYAWPLLVTAAVGIVPLLIVNHLLVGWMIAETDNWAGIPFRYAWHMSLQVFLQAQLASVVATSYLGQAVFEERPSFRKTLWDVARLLPRIAWCQLLLRGVGPAWLLLLTLERHSDIDPSVEFVFLPLLALYAVALRSARPFINEIALLEGNPMAARHRSVMTLGRRSTMLHGANVVELLMRGASSALIGFLLVLAVYGVGVFVSGVFFGSWRQGPILVGYGLPLAEWLVVGYFTVFRFLSYLDLRIRQEGWELVLRLRAEAKRLTAGPVGTYQA